MSNKFQSYVIREARGEDTAELERLAQRDTALPLSGRLLIGEDDGRIRAAIEISSGRSIADPFHRTADLRALLETRASQVRRSRRRLPIAMRTPAPASAGRRLAA